MRLVDGTQGMLVPPGEGKLNILRRFFSLRYPLEGTSKEMAASILREIEFNLEGDARLAQFGVALEDELARNPGPRGFMDTIAAILAAVATVVGPGGEPDAPHESVRWVEKNHNLEFYWNRAKFLFGRPMLLFVLRDVCDNWLSWRAYMEANALESSVSVFARIMGLHYQNETAEAFFGPSLFGDAPELATRYDPSTMCFADTPEGRFAWNYRRMAERALALQAAEPDLVRVVRYEDIVLRTEDTMREVLDFLGCAASGTNLIPTDQGRAWGGNSSFRAMNRGVDGRAVGRGRALLTPDAVGRLLEVVHPVLDALPHVTPPVP